MTIRAAEADESGSAPVEFALVSVLVLALFLSVVQLGFALHVRNTLHATAADGARFGAAAGRDPADAVGRTRELTGAALSGAYAQGVSARSERIDGVATVVVEIEATLPLLGPWGPAGGMSVRAHAIDEDP